MTFDAITDLAKVMNTETPSSALFIAHIGKIAKAILEKKDLEYALLTSIAVGYRLLSQQGIWWDAVNLVKTERERQDAKWGANRTLPKELWLTILVEEVGEVFEQVYNGVVESVELERELVECIAVMYAWLEGGEV